MCTSLVCYQKEEADKLFTFYKEQDDGYITAHFEHKMTKEQKKRYKQMQDFADTLFLLYEQRERMLKTTALEFGKACRHDLTLFAVFQNFPLEVKHKICKYIERKPSQAGIYQGKTLVGEDLVSVSESINIANFSTPREIGVAGSTLCPYPPLLCRHGQDKSAHCVSQ